MPARWGGLSPLDHPFLTPWQALPLVKLWKSWNISHIVSITRIKIFIRICIFWYICIWNTFLIFCLNIIWKADLQEGSNNLTLFRCTWLLLALSRHVYNLEHQHMVLCPFIHLATVSLASAPLPKDKYKQRRTAPKHHLLSGTQAVNDSHLTSYFFLHTHLAYTSSHQHLSLQLSLQRFSLIGARVALLFPNLVCHWLHTPQLTWSAHTSILYIIFLSTYSKIPISCNWETEPLPAVGSLPSQDMFCV